MRGHPKKQVHRLAIGAGLAVLVCLSVPLANGQVSRANVDDPPRIVFNKSVGDVRLGMSRDEVEYLYGDTNQGDLEILNHYFPQGTKYFGKPLYRMTYPLHGGKLVVSYVGDRVKVVETTSRYYRTARNIGVGTRIPLGPRHKLKGGGYEYRWNSFVWEGECGKAWLGGTRTVSTDLYMKRGRITVVEIGDPNVILYCF